MLPLLNISGDPEQEFFADGLTEDIITEMSRFRDLLVISRNSIFLHKGKPVGAEPAALAPPRDLTRQPRSSKRLDHRIPASGRGIVPGCARLGMSERFIRFR